MAGVYRGPSSEKLWCGFVWYCLWSGACLTFAYYQDCSVVKSFGILTNMIFEPCSSISLGLVCFLVYHTSLSLVGFLVFHVESTQKKVVGKRVRVLILATLSVLSLSTQGKLTDYPSFAVSCLLALSSIPLCRLMCLEENFGLFESILKTGIDALMFELVDINRCLSWVILWLVTAAFLFLKREVNKRLGMTA